MKNMTPYFKAIDYRRLCAIQDRLHEDVVAATEAVNVYEKELRAGVTCTKRGETITMQYDGRVIKCSRNNHNRWNIKENKKLIERDMFLSMNEIRLLFALGEI